MIKLNLEITYMKLLTITVPCYNSEAYLDKCMESLIVGGSDVEIIIVDDGSTDSTGEMSDKYAAEYPDIVRVIHQENGGHGAAVMTGMRNSTGLYFRVVDSDDWLDKKSYLSLLSLIREYSTGTMPDVFITNYVYDKVDKKRKQVIRYTKVLPQNRIFTWSDTGFFLPGEYFLMHSLTYNTKFLKGCNLNLPSHTYYEDNIYAYVPMAKVKTMYYLNANMYRYYIGRSDQSVQEQVMLKRIDQQLLVNKLMIDGVNIFSLPDKHQQQYLWKYVEIITTISLILLLLSGTEESMKKREDLWEYIQSKDPELYKRLKNGAFCKVTGTKTDSGRKFAITAYHITRRIYGFN
jgi:glycosyltransferase involved in cell wall biosynthesis